VLYLRLIVSIDSEILVVTDFVNIKIKLIQSSRGAHRDRVCVYVFIGVNAHTYISFYVCTVFLKINIQYT
jgi:hypothetical protein